MKPLFIIGLLLSFYSITPSPASAFEARVVGITDGDTVKVLRNKTMIKIRLHGIDAPESHQAFGTKSKQHLSSLIFDKTVEVTPKDRDKYGRTVARITLDGKDINLQMIEDGYAWWFERYARMERAYAKAEAAARAAKLGLWADPDPIPPWRWRKSTHPQNRHF